MQDKFYAFSEEAREVYEHSTFQTLIYQLIDGQYQVAGRSSRKTSGMPSPTKSSWASSGRTDSGTSWGLTNTFWTTTA
ncbi:hypothetical protein SB57_03880 [Lactobacillus delbrueckii subsp. bulgaricus]|nr:hypothetical protein SB57_03880 [Lactobacillus delbrueckii subsp. bulgaricus]